MAVRRSIGACCLAFQIVVVISVMSLPSGATVALHPSRNAKGTLLSVWGEHGTWQPFPPIVREDVTIALQIRRVNDSGDGIEAGLQEEVVEDSCEQTLLEQSSSFTLEPFPFSMTSAFASAAASGSDDSFPTDNYHYSAEFGVLPGLPVTLAELGPRQLKRQLQPVSFVFNADTGGRRLAPLPADS